MACGCSDKRRIGLRRPIYHHGRASGYVPRGTALGLSENWSQSRTGRYIHRLEICKRCNEVKYFLGRMRCGVCGCFLEIKAWFPRLHCPEGKW